MANPFAGANASAYGSFAQPQAAPWANPATWNNALGSNSNLLLGLGAGLLSGNVATIPQAISAGVEADRSRNLQGYQMSLAMAQRKAADDYVTKLGHPELQGAFSSVGDAIAANKPNVIAPGSTATTGFGDPVATGAGFDGSKNGAWNYLIKAQNNPALRNTPDYQAAYALATEPTMTPQGMMQPNIPPSWAPQAQPAAASAPPASGYSPSASDVAPIGQMSGAAPLSGAGQGAGFQSVSGPAPAAQGPGIIPGTQPFNESQARTTMLTQSAIPDLKRVIDGFPAMLNLKDQMLQQVPGNLGRILQDPAYKQTQDAMTSAIGNVLYVASGANLNAGELQRKVAAYTPAVGDDGKTAANKLDRFANDIIVLANATKDPATIKWAQQAADGLSATRDKLLSGGGAAKPVTGKTSTGVPWSLN